HQGAGTLVVTDGVFSMHGDICELPEIVRLAKHYGARVLVDDAHATGVLGEHGTGTAEHFGLKGQVDLELGTMSKALAGMGGFVVGDEDVIEYLRYYADSYVFAATIPAGVAAGLIAAIDVMESEPQRISSLWSNIRLLRSTLREAGLDLEDTNSAILPIVIGDERTTMEMGRAVRDRGLFCQTVVFPGVPLGQGRLRVSVTSEHTVEDLLQAAEIFVDAARETGVLARRGSDT
ncbi:MAG: aminotransferase class I/II-fold pyridoxal phosphate-dependent enzyme, partial [Actinocrinis sp.]